MKKRTIWGELEEKFGTDYQLSVKLIGLEYIMSILFLIYIFLTSFYLMKPSIVVILPFLFVLSGIQLYGDKKIKMRERMSKTVFKSRIDLPIKIVFTVIAIFMLFIGFNGS